MVVIVFPSPGTPGEGEGGGLGTLEYLMVCERDRSAPTLTLPRSTRGGEENALRSNIKHVSFDSCVPPSFRW
jgi:hypothetical protein